MTTPPPAKASRAAARMASRLRSASRRRDGPLPADATPIALLDLGCDRRRGAVAVAVRDHGGLLAGGNAVRLAGDERPRARGVEHLFLEPGVAAVEHLLRRLVA